MALPFFDIKDSYALINGDHVVQLIFFSVRKFKSVHSWKESNST